MGGETVRVLGTRVDPTRDRVRVDGEVVRPPHAVAILLHKPAGCLTTMADPRGRRTVAELIGDPRLPRLFPVGRLDYDTQGLLVLTNDGELAQRLAHPRHEVRKVYHAKVRGQPSPAALQRLVEGVRAGGERLRALEAWAIRTTDHNAWIGVAIGTGRYRQVRRMCDAIGHPVLKLIRVSVGPLHLGDLPVGAWRRLNPREFEALRALRTATAPTAPPPAAPPARG